MAADNTLECDSDGWRSEKTKMGKLYASELKALESVYRWALKESIEPLVESIQRSACLPLLATGSGGAFTAAHLTSWLHQRYSGKIAKAETPLELVSSFPVGDDVAVLCISAGGRNKDIIGAFKQLVRREPKELTVLCARKNSPLGELARKYSFVNLIEFDLPTGKDGFLATNSLIAFSMLLGRAYASAFEQKDDLPKELDELLASPHTFSQINNHLRDRCQLLWEKQTLVVLYGPASHSAALDLESKFSEAALGNAQISDYRNFAHGRHHWLAKRGATTGVLALVSEDDKSVAEKTLGLIPDEIVKVRIDINGRGVRAHLSSLIYVLLLVGLAGESHGIDPGCPRVSRFGRKLYNLNVFGSSGRFSASLSQNELFAIQRKTGIEVETLMMRGELEHWVKAYRDFVGKITSARFTALVLDFDGTLCDATDRYRGLRDDVAKEVIRVLNAGGLIGVATGRGKSVKESLRSRVPKTLWQQVLIGYYNGADIGFLNEDNHPDPCEELSDPLLGVATAIKVSQALSRLSKCTFRKYQITIEPLSHSWDGLVWDLVSQLVRKVDGSGVTVLRSSHSIDVVAPRVSKQRIVDRLKVMQKSTGHSAILCIGDKGKWPGNDFNLLGEPYSLSVDQVSADAETCWNLAPAGYRGVQATLSYLGALSKTGEAFRFSMTRTNRKGRG